MAAKYFLVYTYYLLSQLPIDGHEFLPSCGYCKLLLWTLGVHVCFLIRVLIFFEYMHRIGIAGSYGSSIFNVLRNLHVIFQSDYTSLHYYPQCRRFLFSLHPLQCLLFVDIFDDSHFHQGEVISHCSFDLHFFNNEWYWAFFMLNYNKV